ncbi:MAG: hypothetical protein F6K55_07345 [Moorea sp. SIO4A3]|nr:hypothetical protein [Moorena sp. SIO4A3]
MPARLSMDTGKMPVLQQDAYCLINISRVGILPARQYGILPARLSMDTGKMPVLQQDASSTAYC